MTYRRLCRLQTRIGLSTFATDFAMSAYMRRLYFLATDRPPARFDAALARTIVTCRRSREPTPTFTRRPNSVGSTCARQSASVSPHRQDAGCVHPVMLLPNNPSDVSASPINAAQQSLPGAHRVMSRPASVGCLSNLCCTAQARWRFPALFVAPVDTMLLRGRQRSESLMALDQE